VLMDGCKTRRLGACVVDARRRCGALPPVRRPGHERASMNTDTSHVIISTITEIEGTIVIAEDRINQNVNIKSLYICLTRLIIYYSSSRQKTSSII